MLESKESKVLFAVAVVLLLFVIAYTPVSAYIMAKANNESFEPKAYMPDRHQTEPSEERAGITDDQDIDVDLENETHQDTILKLGVEQSVIDSHKAFVYDSARTTTGASNVPVREFDDNVVPFVGLKRVNYSVKVGDTARVTPTAENHQLAQATRFLV